MSEAWVSPSPIPQVSASNYCDYPPPVCDPGLGHIGQGRIVPIKNVRGHIVMAYFVVISMGKPTSNEVDSMV